MREYAVVGNKSFITKNPEMGYRSRRNLQESLFEIEKERKELVEEFNLLLYAYNELRKENAKLRLKYEGSCQLRTITLEDILNQYTDTEKYVFEEYLLYGKDFKTIGGDLDVSSQRVSQIFTKICKKLSRGWSNVHLLELYKNGFSFEEKGEN
jgi:DNA-directed RNA polymerase specialized sigma subunit